MKVTEQLEEIIGFGDDDMIMGISGLYSAAEMDQALGEARHSVEVGNLTDMDRTVFFTVNWGYSGFWIIRSREVP